MATVSYNPIANIAKGAYKVTWSGLGVTSSDDVGAALVIPQGYQAIDIQVIGTFANATVTIQGSNDGGTTYATLNDSRGEGNAMTFTAADLKKLNEIPQQIRPLLSSGSGTNVSVIAVVRKV